MKSMLSALKIIYLQLIKVCYANLFRSRMILSFDIAHGDVFFDFLHPNTRQIPLATEEFVSLLHKALIAKAQALNVLIPKELE